MKLKYAPLIAAAVMTIAGCGSVPALLPSSGTISSPAASTSPSTAGCTVASCMIPVMQQSMIGTAVKDGSAITAMTCKPSTLKHNAGNTWTARCTATFSDGSEWSGFMTVLVAQDKVSWEPATQVKP